MLYFEGSFATITTYRAGLPYEQRKKALILSPPVLSGILFIEKQRLLRKKCSLKATLLTVSLLQK